MQGKKRFLLSTKLLNTSFVVIVILVSILIIITNVVVQTKQDEAAKSQKIFLACNDAANTLQKESDLLTLSVSNYVDTQEKSSIDEYFQIIDENLRENEIKKVEKYNIPCSSLREALNLSDELAIIETHAFALIASADNNVDKMPKQVKKYTLSNDEIKLSKEQKILRAQKLIHGKSYNEYKYGIYKKINKFEKEVLDKTEKKVLEETNEIKQSVRLLHIFAVLGDILVIIIAIILYRKVTVVLGRYVKSISNNEHVEEKGTSELRYLASEFNKYIDAKDKEQMELRQKVDVDLLTQVASRGAFEEFVQNRLNQKDTKGAFVFIDVDDFKKINDTYGHDVGDEVLKKLANEVTVKLQSKNLIGRFGGDEFIIWLDGLDENDAEYVEEKLDTLNNTLLNSSELKIGFSISAGIYFCKSGEKYEDVLKCADSALYEKKRNGKKGYSVYKAK